MISSRLARLVLCIAVPTIAVRCLSQTPFDLDTTFRTEIDPWYVSSVLPLGSGQLIVSGMFKFPGDLDFYSLARLNQDGTKDPSFYTSGLGGGKLVEWSGMYYVGTSQTVRRILPTGYLDPDWTEMNAGPYFSSLQGGDYHVYPDGRVLLTGYHNLDDTIRGFVGGYNLIWFSNQGYLDTTRTHRAGDGTLYRIAELPDGRFVCGGYMTEFEGHATTNVFRVYADGAYDTTFAAPITWEFPQILRPLPDGRILCGGAFKVTGDPDTLSLVRLRTDGSLDPTFNNHLQTRFDHSSDVAYAPITSISVLDDARYLITGAFTSIDGVERRSIAVVDTAGNLLDDPIGEAVGCGPYEYMSFTYASMRGAVMAPSGDWYVFGAYHGYNDGTTNDTLQRMVSRLFGLDVGEEEQWAVGSWQFAVSPNPGSDAITLGWGEESLLEAELYDALGRRALRMEGVQGKTAMEVDVRSLAPGLYNVRGQFPSGARALKWVKQ